MVLFIRTLTNVWLMYYWTARDTSLLFPCCFMSFKPSLPDSLAIHLRLFFWDASLSTCE